MLMALRSDLAVRVAERRSLTESGLTIRLTRVALSWEWISLTTASELIASEVPVALGEGASRASRAETELVSAFTNLVANAVRYTPAGGTVSISWRADEQGAEFAVQDTGIGIDQKHIPRLTERFYRVDRGRSRDAGGTGLGLAIVKHSLSRHQAQLDIKSTPGIGSRFAARFPANRVAGL